MVELADVLLAQLRLKAFLSPTPLETAPDLGAQVWLKLENTNQTHSFKVRGALNAMLALPASARQRGILAASSGNHAQGVAYAAHLTATPAQILMPTHTPKRKINGVRRYGAEAVLFGTTFDDAEIEARQRSQAQGRPYLSPYNDLQVMAGAGTIGLEIIETLPQVARVVVCVSGGGLIGGIAVALKALKPDVEIIGVNAEASPAMYNAFYGTQHPQRHDTLAEALSGEIEAGSITLEIAKRHVSQMVMVSEGQIAAAMRWMLGIQGWLVEGGGAVAVAAVLHHLVPRDERPTVIIVSGGNLDLSTLQRILV